MKMEIKDDKFGKETGAAVTDGYGTETGHIVGYEHWGRNGQGKQVLRTPTCEEIKCMNPNYTEFKFPQTKAHPWHKLRGCVRPFLGELCDPNARLPTQMGDHCHLSSSSYIKLPNQWYQTFRS